MERLTIALLALALLTLTGCAELLYADSLAVGTVSKMVSAYCELPEGVRRINHIRWQQAVAPNEITITCN